MSFGKIFSAFPQSLKGTRCLGKLVHAKHQKPFVIKSIRFRKMFLKVEVDRVRSQSKRKTMQFRDMYVCVDHYILLLTHCSNHIDLITKLFQMLCMHQIDRSKATCPFKRFDRLGDWQFIPNTPAPQTNSQPQPLTLITGSSTKTRRIQRRSLVVS